MRGYKALSGRDGAFGWNKEGMDGTNETALGGLIPGERYALSGGESICADAQGRWQGRLAAPLRFAAQGERVILCDESLITWEEAALLARREKTADKRPPQEEKKETDSEPKVPYRTRLNARSVAALPQKKWPRGCEQLRACLTAGKPVRVLPYPWRFVQVKGMGGEGVVGCLTENGCITKTAAAVRARGGLLQPKGLTGYEYVRTDTGEAYWMLIQSVTKA